MGAPFTAATREHRIRCISEDGNHDVEEVISVALPGASFSITSRLAANAQINLFSAETRQQAKSLLKRMTLDEKVGQLNESGGIVFPELLSRNQTKSSFKARSVRFFGSTMSRNQINIAKQLFRHIGRVIVTPAIGCAVTAKILDT